MSPGGDDDSNISLPGLDDEEKGFMGPDGSIENSIEPPLKPRIEKS